MKLPVFLEVPTDDNLLQALFIGPFNEALDLYRTRLFDRFSRTERLVLDRAYWAAPAGRAIAARMHEHRHDLGGGLSRFFTLRGTIEVEDVTSVPERIAGASVLADPRVDTYLTCFDDAAIGNARDVAGKLNTSALHTGGLDGEGVAIAIVDGGINLAFLEQKLGYRPKLDIAYSWQPPGINVLPGEYPVGHGTMCAFAALIAAPKATLIDVPVFVGEPAGGAIIGRRLSLAHQGIAQLSAFWSIAFTPSGARKYKALVINNSWGMFHPSWDFPTGHSGRYSDNPRHVFTRTLAGMSQIDKVDVVFAAGNCGSECPDEKCQNVTNATITGANASGHVLTIAGCDVAEERVGYSSQGPGTAGMESNKPDLAGYTHFLGSEALGNGKPDQGTSAACPLVAGCIAALRTRLDPTATDPSRLNTLLRTTARKPGGAAWDANLGHGVIDPVAAATALGLLSVT